MHWQRVVGLSTGAAALVLGWYALSRPPEPARTALELAAAACGNQDPAERARLLEEHVAEVFELSVASGSGESWQPRFSRAELLEELMRFRALRPRCRLSLRHWRLRPGGGGREWLEGELEYSDSQSGDLHAERRRLAAQFREQGGRQRLERLELGAPEQSQPEARP